MDDAGDVATPHVGPAHARIEAELRRRIKSGELSPGSRLPTETRLMAEFAVSRGTVRQAIAALRSDGSVTGSRGAPPIVRGGRLTQPFAELVSFSAWISSLGRHPGGRVVSLESWRADAPTAAALRIGGGVRVTRLVRVRTADGEPLMVERTVFPADIGTLVAGVDLERSSIYVELAERGISFATASQLIDAVPANALDARLLGVPRRAPLLRVRRISFAPDGRPLESSDDRYRPDRVTLSVRTAAPRTPIVRTLTDLVED